MYKVKYIRDNYDFFTKSMLKRNVSSTLVDEIIFLDNISRSFLHKRQEYERERKDLARQYSRIGNNDTDAKNRSQKIKKIIRNLREKEEEYSEKVLTLISQLPCILDSDVPSGSSDLDNMVLYVSKNKNLRSGPEYDHNKYLSLHNNVRNLSGSRFSIISGSVALLENALCSYFIDFNMKGGFSYLSVPSLCKGSTLFGTGQLPKFAEDLYKVSSKDLWLIPTSEVILANLYKDEFISIESLPLRVTSLTSCFRSEAGASGKDNHGLIRQHEFKKCELVSFIENKNGREELDFLYNHVSSLIESLCLPYRKLILCSSDTGFSSAITYDLEVWMPSQNKYREISSISYCKNFQSLRSNTRYRKDEKVFYPDTLNASSLPIGRTIAAIIENHIETQTNSILLPKCLHKYMNTDRIILDR